MHQSPQVSIVVCTRERPADLANCLQALQPAVLRGHELIVVDNAPQSSRTAALVARFPARYLVEPTPGLDRARNCGLLAARHGIVAFTDDDAVPAHDWAEAIAAPLADSSVGCATGLVLPLELATEAQRRFEVYCAHRRVATQRSFAAPATPAAAAGIVGMGANMALPRELALRLGGFDMRLDGGTATRSGGDTDMFARVLDAGTRIVYTPEARVYHRHRREMAELRHCLFGYGVGLYAFLTKRLLEHGDADALLVAARWLVGPTLKASWRALHGQPAVSPALLACEAFGALYGPLAYWRERRQNSQYICGECGGNTTHELRSN